MRKRLAHGFHNATIRKKLHADSKEPHLRKAVQIMVNASSRRVSSTQDGFENE